MGTAGHIDHGKTTLIRMLTGRDCDTHKEEKQRGITIYLGFSHYTLQNGNTIGIVDVPGHGDFINTMIAGAAGIDFVLFVIAADAGIMPQTLEHLQIMSILGISKGVVVLTKTDLVEPDYIELIEEEIAEITEGTFLENAPIIKFSAIDKSGLDELKEALEQIEIDLPPRREKEIFRLYIDRVFSLTGFGTVVTGTVQNGRINKESRLQLLPSEKKVRIRKMERYGVTVNELIAGDRGSLNLTGVDQDEIERGMLLSDKYIQETSMIDCNLTLFPGSKPLKVWSQGLFLHGTKQYETRIHLLDRDVLKPGETGIVQLHFKTPIFACYDDRYVLRNSSADFTLGGGNIFDITPLHHRRRTAKLLERLKKIATGDLTELISYEVRKRELPVNLEDLVQIYNISLQELLETAEKELPDDIVVNKTENAIYLQEELQYTRSGNRIFNNIRTYHKNNPLVATGRTFDELSGLFGNWNKDLINNYLRFIIEELVKNKRLTKVKNTWTLSEHKVVLSPQMQARADFIELFLKSYGLRIPLKSELIPSAKAQGIDEKTLNQILQYLVESGKIYRIEEDYVHSEIVDDVRKKLLTALLDNKEGLTVAEFRDLIDGNRKICLLLLAQFDGEGTTIRKGDYRIISSKGKAWLEKN